MKNFLKVLALLSLSGCANQTLLPSKFDNVLYARTVHLSVELDQAVDKCSAPTFVDTFSNIQQRGKIILQYTQFSSTDVHPQAEIIDKDIEKFVAAEKRQPPPTKTYCTLTLNTIQTEVQALLKTLGSK